MTVAVFVLALAATARVTRFITRDSLFAPVRDWVAVHAGPDSRLYTLITCVWCSSVWIAAPAAVTAWWWGHTVWWQVVCMVLALSYLTSVAATWIDPDG